MADQVVLEIFSDYVWPWCYLSTGRIEKIKENFDVEMKLVHFPLHPETPDEGRTLQKMFSSGPEEIQAKNDRMRGLMEAEGLPYNDRTHTYNSRLAQELGKWADTQPGGDAIHLPIYQAYFVDNRNIGDPKVLLNIVETVGLDVEAAREVLEGRTLKNAVDTDWGKSRDYHVTGVPTYVAGGRSVVGAQPYEAIAELLEAAGANQKAEDAVE